MRTYIDSDGVLSDFHGWVASFNNGVLDENVDIDRLIIENYETCYICAEELKHKDLWFLLLGIDPDWYVLSSVGSVERFMRACPELGREEVERRYNILKENKYRWFEERGIPRDKVILVGESSEKVKYCHENDILYDDYDKTIDAWNASGGVAIKVYNYYRDKRYVS